MTAKEALNMLNECGTNIESPYEQQVLVALNKALTEQEKKDELLGLKNEMINAYQAYLASSHTIDIPMIDKWKNEIFRLQNVIYTKEKELEELK